MNVLRRIWTILNLVFLYLGYFLVGIPKEDFHVRKGNYFVDLGWYHRAIQNYKKALEDSDDPHIHSMLGYCYSRIKAPLDSVQHYSKAREKIGDPRIDIELANSEFDCGNIEKSEEIMWKVRRSNYHLDSQDVETLDSLETAIEMVKKARKDLKRPTD
jgi:tetratricopeptide (TPR) repeat protein